MDDDDYDATLTAKMPSILILELTPSKHDPSPTIFHFCSISHHVPSVVTQREYIAQQTAPFPPFAEKTCDTTMP